MKDYSQKDIDYATLLLRVTLGIFFALAGLAQLANIAGLANSVTGFAIAEDTQILSIAGALLPWVELILGLLLIFGLSTSLVSSIVALLSFVFAAKNGFMTGSSISKEIMFVTVALTLMLLGGGSISLDGKIKQKKK